jgi:Opacity family porin protein
MNRTHLISLTAVAMAMTGVVASGANAQEKQYSIGPAIEFSGGGTSFGIKGKIGVGPSISIRPSILFGYTPNVSAADFNKAVANGVANSLNTLVPLTNAQKIAIVKKEFGANLPDAEVQKLIADAEEAVTTGGRTAAQQALIDATKPTVKSLSDVEKRTIVRAIAGNSLLGDDAADAQLKAAIAAGTSGNPVQQKLVTDTKDIVTPLTQAEILVIVNKGKTAGALLDETAANNLVADANLAKLTRTPAQVALLKALEPTLTPLTVAEKRAAIRNVNPNITRSDAAADTLLADALAAPAVGRSTEQIAFLTATKDITTDAAKTTFVQAQPENSALNAADALKLFNDTNTAALAVPVVRTPTQIAFLTATKDITTDAAKTTFVQAQPENSALNAADALKLFNDTNTAALAVPAVRTDDQKEFVRVTKDKESIVDRPLAAKTFLGNALSDADADAKLKAALAAPAIARTSQQLALLNATKDTVTPLTNIQIAAILNKDLAATATPKTPAEAEAELKAALAALVRTEAQKALIAGTRDVVTPKTADEKRAAARGVLGTTNAGLSDAEVDKLLAAAIAAPAVAQTNEQRAIAIAASKDKLAFSLLTPEQQRAQVRFFSEIALTDKQADNLANLATIAINTPSVNRTKDQEYLVSIVSPTASLDDFNAFSALTPLEKRAEIQAFYSPQTDADVDAFAKTLSDGNDFALSTAQSRVSLAANTAATGFTPGSGTAYGAAVTYDFSSADSKFSGYVGPRVMFANGSGKVGNFDTNTSETSLGLLLGADYAITPDFTAGLSGTYNFSKTGTLNVSAPGGFNGSSSISGSSFDVGINFGYRF